MTSKATTSVREYYAASFETLEKVSEILADEFAEQGRKDLSSELFATDFILTWMREYFLFQRKFDALFQRSVASSAGDQFTAVVALTLEKFLEAHGLPGCVKSEAGLALVHSKIRPDVSVWYKGQLQGIIECKTQFGRKRDSWADEYRSRTHDLHTMYPQCPSFLCVLTSVNWETSWFHFRDSALAGSRWFCLTEHWPPNLPDNVLEGMIHPIEPMLNELLDLLKAADLTSRN